jgi:hypothetical protein
MISRLPQPGQARERPTSWIGALMLALQLEHLKEIRKLIHQSSKATK